MTWTCLMCSEVTESTPEPTREELRHLCRRCVPFQGDPMHMTVGQLIEALSEFPDYRPVAVNYASHQLLEVVEQGDDPVVVIR